MRKLNKVWNFLLQLARELSDEGAYARHLQASGAFHCAAEWRAFIDDRHRRKYQNGKCC